MLPSLPTLRVPSASSDFGGFVLRFVRCVRPLPNKLLLKYSTGSALAGHVTPNVSFRSRLYFYSHTGSDLSKVAAFSNDVIRKQ